MKPRPRSTRRRPFCACSGRKVRRKRRATPRVAVSPLACALHVRSVPDATGVMSEQGGALSAERRVDQLGRLLAGISLRVTTWGWLTVYERWRRGEPTTKLQRKWLGISIRAAHLELAGKKLTVADVRAAIPWPENHR